MSSYKPEVLISQLLDKISTVDVDILSRSCDMSASGLAAAILDFRLLVTFDRISYSAFEFLDPKNMASLWNFVAL